MAGTWEPERVSWRRRRRSLIGALVISVAVLVPAAVAWACAPLPSLVFDSPPHIYVQGDTVTVTGRQFPPHRGVSFTVEPGLPGVQQPLRATTDEYGRFQIRFRLADDAEPRNYRVRARSDPNDRGQYAAVAEAFEVRPRPVVEVVPPAPPPAADPRRLTRASALRRARRRCQRRYRLEGLRGSARSRQLRNRRACIRRAIRRLSR